MYISTIERPVLHISNSHIIISAVSLIIIFGISYINNEIIISLSYFRIFLMRYVEDRRFYFILRCQLSFTSLQPFRSR